MKMDISRGIQEIKDEGLSPYHLHTKVGHSSIDSTNHTAEGIAVHVGRCRDKNQKARTRLSGLLLLHNEGSVTLLTPTSPRNIKPDNTLSALNRRHFDHRVYIGKITGPWAINNLSTRAFWTVIGVWQMQINHKGVLKGSTLPT